MTEGVTISRFYCICNYRNHAPLNVANKNYPTFTSKFLVLNNRSTVVLSRNRTIFHLLFLGDMFNEMSRDNIFDDSDKRFEEFNDTTSPLLLIKHMKRSQIVLDEEIEEYLFYDFVSDAGGLLGIFVGFSFISLYQSLRDFVIKIWKKGNSSFV